MTVFYSKALHLINERTKVLKDSQTAFALKLKTQQVKLANAIEQLERVNATKNPLHTDAAHAKEVIKSSETIERLIGRFEQEKAAIAQDGYVKLPQMLNDATGLKDGRFAREVREHVRSMTQSQRLSFVKNAIERKDGETLHAVFDAPEFLTGIDKTAKDRLLESYWSTHAPQLYQEYTNFHETYDSNTAAMNAARKAVDQIKAQFDMSEISKQEQAANEAKESFLLASSADE